MFVLVTAAVITVFGPLAGAALAGRALEGLLHFPPQTVFVLHAPFSWFGFVAALVPSIAAAGLFAAAIPRAGTNYPLPVRRPFPWWGWLGVALAGAAWTAAWTEDLLPPQWRRHVFTPLWLGYVLVLGGLCHGRGGVPPLTARPAFFVFLFPLSAVFWWLFEHLNRFSANWYYTGVVAYSDLDYFLQATLPFSTVLPAIATTIAWLRSWPRLDGLRLPAVRGSRAMAWAAVIAGSAGLAAVGAWPGPSYPALWLAPLFLLAGLQPILTGRSLLSPLAGGDWRPALQPAAAALFCGFFWELWNSGSAAQWHYSVPYVQRFHVFEMPLAGYGGYLPFGIICALVMDLAARIVEGGGLYEDDARP